MEAAHHPFAMHARQAGAKPVTRLLEGPLPIVNTSVTLIGRSAIALRAALIVAVLVTACSKVMRVPVPRPTSRVF